MKKIAKWLAAISIIILVVNIAVPVAGGLVTSALINGDYNISAGTFIAVISFVVRTIHIGAAVACGILAVADHVVDVEQEREVSEVGVSLFRLYSDSTGYSLRDYD